MRHLDNLHEEQISRAFMKEAEAFTQYIYKECRVKEVTPNQPVDGESELNPLLQMGQCLSYLPLLHFNTN